MGKLNQIYTEPTLEEFWNILLQTYHEMQGGKRYNFYIQIGKLRDRISKKLGFTDKDVFNQYLVKILEDKEHRMNVRLHGGPTIAYDKLESFEFNNKLYLLLSLINV